MNVFSFENMSRGVGMGGAFFEKRECLLTLILHGEMYVDSIFHPFPKRFLITLRRFSDSHPPSLARRNILPDCLFLPLSLCRQALKILVPVLITSRSQIIRFYTSQYKRSWVLTMKRFIIRIWITEDIQQKRHHLFFVAEFHKRYDYSRHHNY